MSEKKVKTSIERLDDYIEFAEATKKFSDVGFYNELRAEILRLQDYEWMYKSCSK